MKPKGFSFLTGILLLLMPFLMFGMTSCTKANFASFFADLGNEIPIEKVSYKIAVPDQDTLIIWYSPYQLFENRTNFKSDSIYHSEQFNWRGLGDFLYEKYQERKIRRAKIKESQDNNTSYRLPRNDLSNDDLESICSPYLVSRCSLRFDRFIINQNNENTLSSTRKPISHQRESSYG
jgi:hypothetical protein